MEKLNILIRTSNRPKFFESCIKSIKKQTIFHKINIIVHSDNPADTYCNYYNLVKSNRCFEQKPRINKSWFSPFNLYFNKMYARVKEGYIMFLDDDDRFTRADSAEKILNILTEDTLLFWRALVSERIVPNDENFRNHPVYRDISGITFAFHSKYIPFALWDGYKQGDYRLASKLYDSIPEKNYIDEILTATQIQKNGMGQRQDKEATKIIVMTAIYKRPQILKLFLKAYKRFEDAAPSYVNVKLVCIVSEEDKYYNQIINLLGERNIDIIKYYNDNIGEKHTAGVNYIKGKYKFDYLMNIGSDDLINPDIWKLYDDYLRYDVKYFGLNRFFIKEGDEIMSFKTKNDLIVGGCRMIHFDIIKRLWDMYGKQNGGLDTESDKRIKQLGYIPVIINTKKCYCLDLKSPTNINSFEMLKQSDLTEKATKYEINAIRKTYKGIIDD